MRMKEMIAHLGSFDRQTNSPSQYIKKSMEKMDIGVRVQKIKGFVFTQYNHFLKWLFSKFILWGWESSKVMWHKSLDILNSHLKKQLTALVGKILHDMMPVSIANKQASAVIKQLFEHLEN